MTKVGINGLGRIGKIVLIQLLQQNIDVVAVNIPDFDIEHLETYLQFDSTHCYTPFNVHVIDESTFMINNKKIHLFNSRDATKLVWKDYHVDYVIDATGVYLTETKAKEHDVDYLIMCAPAKDDTPSFMVNGNHDLYAGERIVSNVSCTSNALIPVLKVLNDNFIISDANFITIHSTTSSQQLVDTVKFKNRTSRSIFNNIIPHTTGASKSIYKILPELEGKIHGTSVRVPTSNVSLIDLNIKLEKNSTLSSVLSILDEYKYIVVDDNKFKISCDYNTTTCPSIIDKKACMEMQKNQYKISIWYDNEWSYSAKVVELLNHMIDYNTQHQQAKNTLRHDPQFIENKTLQNKRIILRLDWNVPIKHGVIQDYFRIHSTLKTIEYILTQQPAYIMIVSHLGRPKQIDSLYSFETYVDQINRYLCKHTHFSVKLVNTNVLQNEQNEQNNMFCASNNNCVYLMDNVRFIDEETNKSINYDSIKSMYLSMGDVFINDAFGCCHRDHLSITAPFDKPEKWCYGYLIEQETSALSHIINNPKQKKVLAIIGGAKMDDKLPLLENLSKRVDSIFVAGGNITGILQTPSYQQFIEKIQKNSADVVLMNDGLCSKDLHSQPTYRTNDEYIMGEPFFDIGMQSMNQLYDMINSHDIIFWNGTLGVVEHALYKHGSVNLVKYLMKSNKDVIIGGGDTAGFVNLFDHNFHYVSTGGGASLEYLSHGKLIGLSPLTN